MAAEAGEPQASCNMGLMYRQGDGVAKDHTLAMKFYTLMVTSVKGHAEVVQALLRAGGSQYMQNADVG